MPNQEWSLQTEPEAAPSGSASSSSSAVATAASSASPDGHHDEEAHLQELAGKLYDKISVRLKKELLVDRERAGLLTDLR
jgi:hypothetical protein